MLSWLKKIYLCGITATPPHREIRKTALGATESVEWEYLKNTPAAIEQLKTAGYITVGVEQTKNSMPLPSFTPTAQQKTALVFGHEVKGIAQEVIDLCDCCVEIPQLGTQAFTKHIGCCRHCNLGRFLKNQSIKKAARRQLLISFQRMN